MTKFMDKIMEAVIERVAIRDNSLYSALEISDSVEKISFREGTKYSLTITWKGEVIIEGQEDLYNAKLHLIEKLMYALYNDVLVDLFLLNDCLYKRDIIEAHDVLQRIVSRITGEH